MTSKHLLIRDLGIQKTIIDNNINDLLKQIELLDRHQDLFNTVEEREILNNKRNQLHNKIKQLRQEYKQASIQMSLELAALTKRA